MSTASPGLHQTVLGAISSHSPGRQTHRDNSNQDSYDQIARSLRKALRDDDVEMEDASGWPANWESEGEGDVEAECGKTGVIQQMSGHVPHLDKTNAREPRAITYLALDTNIFISHLSTVKLLHDAISRRDDCARPSTLPELDNISPSFSSIKELDRQKNRWNESCSSPSGKGTTSSMRIYTRSLNASRHAESSEQSGFARTSTQSLAVAARTAIEWLLKVRQTQRRARQDVASAMVFQKKEEALSYDAIAKADDRILDCCEYFQSQGMQPAAAIRRKVILWTDDKNLSLQLGSIRRKYTT
ncbi:hypothetical protein QFC19_003042 [Naganishia cerealis]|uniref:Uncharacterized protein n=1 Tax=Naganishia cerealis TaxID=610337 RepID=A0ACC2W5W2_9TREE|nr:hypothetical protein QFC19_003042 [Naganishia cerealis]